MKMSRRALLGASTASITSLTLAACAGQTTAQVTQEVITYGGAIANGLLTLATLVPGIGTIATYAKDAIAIADTLSTSMTQTAGQSVVNQIVTDVSNSITAAGNQVATGSTAGNILSDIKVALPLLQSAAGVISNLAGAPLGSSAAMGRLIALPKAKSV